MLYFPRDLDGCSSLADESPVVSSGGTGTASTKSLKKKKKEIGTLHFFENTSTYIHCICFILHFVLTCNGACTVL